MRLLCLDFLMATIGPTVQRICADNPLPSDDELVRITHDCWDCIYSEQCLHSVSINADFSPSALVPSVC